MEPFNIIAFDPGGTTGIATAHYSGLSEPTLGTFTVATAELGPEEHQNEFWEYLTGWYEATAKHPIPNYTIIESFEFRQNLKKDKVELVSKEYIGITKLFAAQYNTTYFERNAGQAKRFVSDEKLDRLGILEVPKHPNRHRNDALRHLIMYLVVNLRIQSPITNQWRNDE